MDIIKIWSFSIGLFAALISQRELALVAIAVFLTSFVSEHLLTKGYLLIMAKIVLTDEQKVTLSLAPKTAAGNPATLDGAPVWSVSDPEVLELVVDADGLGAVVVAKGLGVAQVSVVADVDLDADETRELSGVLDVVVVAAEAATLGVAAGTPELK